MTSISRTSIHDALNLVHYWTDAARGDMQIGTADAALIATNQLGLNAAEENILRHALHLPQVRDES